VEVNTTVNYPIKEILSGLVASDKIDMGNEVTKFCVSWVSCRVANHGLVKFAEYWNCHSIPSKRRSFTFYISLFILANVFYLTLPSHSVAIY